MNGLPFEEIRWGGTQRIRWIRPLVYLGCAAAFYTDVTNDISLFFGLFYVPLVCTAIFHKRKDSAWWLAGLSISMIVVGFFLPNMATHFLQGIINRSLQITAILITAVLVNHARLVQDRLVEQTRRTESAERIKSMVLTNLSQEIRAPLHAMVSLSELMQAGSRPDQQPALRQVNTSARRLLATIENLVDLTQLEERELRVEPIDLGSLLRQTADGARAGASEKHISVDVAVPPGPSALTQGDTWAVRRILENLIANAVKFSPAGSTVVVATEAKPGSVSALVHDDGVGMPGHVVRKLGDPYYQVDTDGTVATGTGTGLALSRRLASAMGAELTFNSEPGVGTTAVLRMPC